MSGTAEMALGGLLQNTTFELGSLPQKYVAVSRCFRKEVDSSAAHGIYR